MAQMINMIKKPYELEPPRGSKTCLYGPPGLGKTTLGLSGPVPLLLDFDGGTHRVLAKHLKDTLQVRVWIDVVDAMNGERGDVTQYRSLAIDTGGKLLDCMSEEIKRVNAKGHVKRDGNLTQSGYGARKLMFQQFVSKLSFMGIHVIFLCHEDEEKVGEEKFFRPKLGGSSRDDLMPELDLVGHMEARPGGVRIISFEPSEKYFGKNSCGLDPEIILQDPEHFPNDFLTKIFSDYEQSAMDRIVMSKEYDTLMQIIFNDLGEIKDADGANSFIECIDSNYKHIWDSRKQASVGLKAKASELTLILDPDKKKYSPMQRESVERSQGETGTGKVETSKGPAAGGKKVDKTSPKKKAPTKKDLQTKFNKLCKACKTKPTKKSMAAVNDFWEKNPDLKTQENEDQILDLQHTLSEVGK